MRFSSTKNKLKKLELINNENSFKESKLKKINKNFSSINYYNKLKSVILVDDEKQIPEENNGGGGGMEG